MDKLKELMGLCKFGVHVTVNQHRDFYETADGYIKRRADMFEYTDDEVVSEMIERDNIIEVTAFPGTPIGSYTAYHYDLDTALLEVLEAVRDDRDLSVRTDVDIRAQRILDDSRKI